MEYQYEYFMSDALALPKDAWKPFHNAGPVLSYPKNKLLYNQGDTAFCFYYIVSGRIKTFISSAEGNERLLTIYRRGDILGEAAFFDERPRVSSAQMMADTKVGSIDRPALERCMQQFPALAFSLLRYLSATVRMLSTHLDATSFLPAEKRIVRLLLNMDSGGNHTVTCTHEELAYALGLSRVTVSRILSGLAKQGMIVLGYRNIQLLNRKKLENLIADLMENS